MAVKLPYMLSTGLLPKILNKIKDARKPERFTQDFLGTKLGYTSGSAQVIIPLLKRMRFLGSDGMPTNLYDQFRNPSTQKIAVAEGMKNAFPDIFDRNQYAQDLSKEDLANLVVEITGATKKDRTTKAIVTTFMTLNEFADFEAESDIKLPSTTQSDIPERQDSPSTQHSSTGNSLSSSDGVRFQVGYTINLNLPETTDLNVFNAIFQSLKENLIKN